MPGDNLTPEHEEESGNQGQAADLTNGTRTAANGIVAQQQAERIRQLVEHVGITILDSLLHHSQRRGTCSGVGIFQQMAGLGPTGHLGREGNQQHATAYQCGIEDIVAQSAKGHLAHADSEEGTDDDDPDGEV